MGKSISSTASCAEESLRVPRRGHLSFDELEARLQGAQERAHREPMHD